MLSATLFTLALLHLSHISDLSTSTSNLPFQMNRNASSHVYLFVFAGTAAVLSVTVALLNWLVDPLQYYRRAEYPPEYSIRARYQNLGWPGITITMR